MSDAPLPSSFDSDPDFYLENRWQKFTRRLKEEPLIPFGVALTCWAFYGAAGSIRKGESSRANQYFRYRLYAQSFTIIAMMGGSYYYNADRLRRKEYTDLVNKRKAQEKRDAWIRELEARDQEDKDWRQKLGKAKDFQREEKERQAAEDKKRGSDDGRGVINAVKEKLKDAKDAEVKSQTAEQKLMAEKRQEAERKQEVERRRQAAVKEKAGMGPDRRIWGEGGGGLFGWRHIKNWYNRPRGDGSKDDKSDGQ